MAATATPANGTALAAIDLESRKTKFAELLRAKVDQGYDVESQSDTEAVIVTRSRHRRFRSRMVGKRQHVSIDHQGKITTHTLEQ
jgi:hypothetical protein